MEKIKINQIKESKYLSEALGISEKKLSKWIKKINKKYHGDLKMIANDLELQKEEIMGSILYNDKISEAIQWIWKNKKRTEITIEECVGTIVLIEGLKEEGLFLRKLIEFLSKKGKTKVKIFSPECLEWTKKHGSCQGCESELNCLKLAAIGEVLRISNLYTPRSFFDFLARERWQVETINKILQTTTLEQLQKLFP